MAKQGRSIIVFKYCIVMSDEPDFEINLTASGIAEDESELMEREKELRKTFGYIESTCSTIRHYWNWFIWQCCQG